MGATNRRPVELVVLGAVSRRVAVDRLARRREEMVVRGRLMRLGLVTVAAAGQATVVRVQAGPEVPEESPAEAALEVVRLVVTINQPAPAARVVQAQSERSVSGLGSR